MKLQRMCTAIFSLLCTCFIPSVHAQDVYKLDQVLSPDSKILIGKLDNGLTYYIRANKRPEQRAELRLVVKAGSILEDDDQQGLAHFVEHMAFDGTKNFPKQALVDFLEKSGVRFGPELNAYTSFDETVYMLQVPTDSPEVMKTGFKILEEWAHDISLLDSAIDKERNVLVEEWRLQRGAEYRVSMKHIPIELYNSQYAERIVIGKKEILETCPYSAIRRFYKDWYRPDLMAIVAVGDFNPGDIKNLIQEHFSSLKDPDNERMRNEYPIPDHRETLISLVTDPELTRASAEVLFKRDARDTRTAGDYRNDIIDNLYDAMLNARYQEVLQQPNPPFIYAYSVDGRFIGYKQAYTLGVSLKENAILGGLESILKEAYRVKQHGFTESELERQKTESLRGMERYYQERNKTESYQYASEYIRNFLERETIPGIEVELAMHKQFLPGITLQEVNALAGKRMGAENRVITISAPQKGSVIMPSQEAIKALLHTIETERLEPYTDKFSSEPLISHLPALGKVISEIKIPSLGLIEWKLSNGMKVVLKPTDFKNDELLFSSFSNGGTSLVPDSEYISAAFATSIIDHSGIGNFDAIELEKKLSGKIVSVNPSIGPLTEGINGSASPQDMETLFQLIYLYGTAPRKDSTAFSSLITRYKAMLQNRNVSPEAAYNDTMQVTLANYHFRSRPVSIPMVEEIRFDKAISIYKDRFANFGDFTFIFVGNFKPATLKPLVEQFLATLPSLNRKEYWRDVGIKPPKGIITKAVYKGIEPKSTVTMVFTGPFQWSQPNRYHFNAMIEALNIKLREVLREDMGGTYGVRVSGSTSLFPRQEYSISLSWGCNPDRVEELVQTTLLQIDSLKLKKMDPVYIEKVREMQLRTHEVNLKQNGFWLNNLRAYYGNKENPEMILNYPGLVKHLTGAAIQQAIKKYFDLNNYIKVVLYPEKKE